MATQVIRSAKDVSSWIDSQDGIRGRARTIWWLVLGGLFLDAYANSAVSAGINPLQEQLGFSADQMALIQTAPVIMAIPISIFVGWASDKWGRFPLVISSKVLFVAGILLVITSNDVAPIVIGRLIVGAAYGFDFAVALAYLAEFTPAKRAARLNLWQAVWYIAFVVNLVITWLGWELWYSTAPDPLNIWRFALVSTVVFAIALFVLQLRLMPESPRWLAGKGRLEAAARALHRAYPDVTFVAEESAASAGREEARPKNAPYSTILRGAYRIRMVLAATVSFGQSLQYYGIGLYMAVIAIVLTTDYSDPANPVTDLGASLLLTLFFNCFGVVGGFLAPVVGRRLGLRRASAYGFAGVAAVLLALAWIMTQVESGATTPLVRVLIYAVPGLFFLFHAAGPGPNGTSLAALSVRSEVRGTATSFSQVAGSVGALIGIYLFLPLAEAIGYGATVAWIAIVPAVCAVIAFLIKWEPTRPGFSADDEIDAPGRAAAAGAKN